MKKVKVKRVNHFDESTDIYTEFFKPYELTAFEDHFCITMVNSARCEHTRSTKALHTNSCCWDGVKIAMLMEARLFR